MAEEVISRSRCAVVLGAVLVAGLASRRVASSPGFVVANFGDVLWATAAVLALAFVRPAWSPYRLCAVGFGFAVAIELSQLWRPRWLSDLRDNDLAALVLGRGFLWDDFVHYAVGVAIAFLILEALPRSPVARA